MISLHQDSLAADHQDGRAFKVSLDKEVLQPVLYEYIMIKNENYSEINRNITCSCMQFKCLFEYQKNDWTGYVYS